MACGFDCVGGVVEMIATIILWDHEAVYESPARKTFNVNWDGELIRADFTFNSLLRDQKSDT